MVKFSKEVKQILEAICKEHSHSLTFSECKEALQTLDYNMAMTDDFTINLDGSEYRIIDDDAIWDIYVETIKNFVKDRYGLKLNNIPSFIAFEIDWEQTAKNTYVDGYGHTFSHYDGSEVEAGGYYIFHTK